MVSLFLQLTFVAVSAISTFVVSPVCLFYCFRLWQRRKISYFKKRQVKLSIFCPLITTAQMLLQIVAELPHVFPALFGGLSASQLSHWHMYGGQINFAAELIRLWFLFFSYNKGLQTIKHEWAKQADRVQTRARSFWALGDSWYTDRSCTIYCIGTAWVVYDFALTVSIMSLKRIELYWVLSVPSLLLCAFAFVLACKVRRSRDDLFIRTEFKYLGGIALTVVATILVLDNCEALDPAQLSTVRVAVFTALLVPFYYVSTKWVIDQYDRRMADNKQLSDRSKNGAKLPLQTVFADKDFFDLFAQHLVRQFCIESLLFLMDATRLKQQCIEHELFKPAQDADPPFTFARNLHRRDGEVFDAVSFFEGVRHIYTRYIAQSAEYSINICSDTRAKFTTSFAPFTELFAVQRPLASPSQDLAIYMAFSATEMPGVAALFVNLLSVAMREIADLLRLDSLLRFRNKEEYRELAFRKQRDAQQSSERTFDNWRMKILPSSPYNKWKHHANKSANRAGMRSDSGSLRQRAPTRIERIGATVEVQLAKAAATAPLPCATAGDPQLERTMAVACDPRRSTLCFPGLIAEVNGGHQEEDEDDIDESELDLEGSRSTRM